MRQSVKKIYLDHAATTPLDPAVKKAMEPYWTDVFGNPSSIHSMGRAAKIALEDARKTIAGIFHARTSEIIFTGSGTESVNLAVLGAARAYKKYGKHIITTKIEHHAVLNAVQALEMEGFTVTYLDVDKDGLVDPRKVKSALRSDTILVSVMHANNEIGTIEPICEISKIIRNFRSTKHEARSTNKISNFGFRISDFPLFHTDACQAAGSLDLNVDKLGVDLASINGSKIYGPKGVGALYVRSGIKLEPLIYGGGQEQNLRSGTENIPLIAGLVVALKISEDLKSKENIRLSGLRDYFIGRILKEIPGAVLNGHPVKRLPNNVNISIADLEGDTAVLYLDEKGVAISTGSACSSVSLEPSHVIMALGRSRAYALGSLRFSLGRTTVKKDLDAALGSLVEVLSLLRKS